jgi:hypothetical protein
MLGGFGGGIPNFSYFKKKMKKDLVVREKGVISTYETRIHFQNHKNHKP